MMMVRTRFGIMPLKDLTMERKRVEEFEETLRYRLWVNQSYFFFRVSLSKFSLEALFQSWVIGVFILEWRGMWNVRFLQNRGGSRLDLAAWPSREIQSRDNRMASCPVLSCSAPACMTVHLPACLAYVLRLAACSRESPASPSRKSLFSCTLLSNFHSISLTTLTSNPPKYRVTKCWITSKFGTE